MKRILILILSLTLSIILTSCDRISINKTNKSIEAINPAEDFLIHEVSDTLHDVNIDYDNPVGDFYDSSRRSEYRIIYENSAYVSSSSFLSRYIKEATYLTIETNDESCLTKREDGKYNLDDGKYIIIGTSKLYENTDYPMSAELKGELGVSGYHIVTKGDDILIQLNGEDGAQLSVIALLRALVGYEMYSSDMVKFTRDGKVVPRMEIKERPDYDYRIKNNQYPTSEAEGLGTYSSSLYMSTSWGAVHNLYDYIGGYTSDSTSTTKTQANTYSDHPLWFSSDGNQPCFTAHGNKEEFDVMTTAYAEGVYKKICDNPTSVNIRFSQNDNAGGMTTRRCTCEACNASYEYYGKTIGGAMLTFVNAVAEKVEEMKAKDGMALETNYIILCYGEALRAPAKRDSSGNYIYGTDGKGVAVTEYTFDESGKGSAVVDESGNEVELVCKKSVQIEFAPSGADWWHSFYEDQNIVWSPSIKAWCGLSRTYGSERSGQLFIWAYEAAFYQYLYPYNNFDSLAEQIRFFKEQGAKYYYSEGTYENPNNPGFTKLKDYLVARLTADVNLNYQDLMEDRFDNYFDVAAPYMMTMFLEIQANLKNHETDVGGYFFSSALSDASVWPEGMIRGWMRLIDQALSAIEVYKTSDPDLYKVLYDHITIESLFPRYVLSTTYSISFDTEILKEMRKSFKKDFLYYKNTTHQERYTISDVFATWDLD